MRFDVPADDVIFLYKSHKSKQEASVAHRPSKKKHQKTTKKKEALKKVGEGSSSS